MRGIFYCSFSNANVADFEMDAVSINGIPLSLDIDVDDSELTEEIDKLTDAVDEIDDVTSKLTDGTGGTF